MANDSLRRKNKFDNMAQDAIKKIDFLAVELEEAKRHINDKRFDLLSGGVCKSTAFSLDMLLVEMYSTNHYVD